MASILEGAVTYSLNRAKSIAGTLGSVGGYLYTQGLSYIETRLGVITLSGTSTYLKVKYISKSGVLLFSGIVSWAGGLLINRTYDGVLYTFGTITRKINVTHAYDGVLTFVGNALSGILPRYSGELESSGINERLVQYYRAVSGVLNQAGEAGVTSAVAEFFKNGVLTLHGRLTLIDVDIRRLSDASTNLVGTLAKIIQRLSSIDGVLTFSGSLLKFANYPITKAGVLDLAGEVAGTTAGLWVNAYSGVLTLAGGLTRLIDVTHTYVGDLTLSGALSKLANVFRAYAGSLTFAGSALADITGRDWRLGYLTFAGASTPYLGVTRLAYASAMPMSGVVTRTVVAARSIRGSQTFESFMLKYKDILYYGPPNP